MWLHKVSYIKQCGKRMGSSYFLWDSYKLNPSLGTVALTPKPQSGLFVYGVKLPMG
jgi:hypothetical protein